MDDFNIDFDCKEEFQIRFWTIDDIIGIDHLFSVIDSFQVFNATFYILKKNR